MENKILVETSARHVHVTAETLAVLFGEGAELTVKAWLSQPGQFASEQQVDVTGPKGTIKKMRILGPVRAADQVEVSLSDARALGIAAPVRESGDIAGTPGCVIAGPNGSVEIKEGVIAAKRHIHFTPAEAEAYGVADKEIVAVEVKNSVRSLIFGDVVVRVNEKFAAAMHIDTDESNAAACSGEVYGRIIK